MTKTSDQWVYGIHAVEAALRHEPDNIQALWFVTPLTNARLLQLQQQAEQLGLPLNQAQRAELDRRSSGGRHQGVLAQLKQAVSYREQDLLALLDRLTDTPLLLALDGVQDPHNLGACLRTADAAGVHAVLAPADRAVGLTPSVRKIASGASVPFVQVSNLARTLRQLQQRGLWVVGAAGEADDSLYEADLQGPLVIVLGAEGKGLRRLTREHCDRLVSIPMSGSVASLNVSVATGVVLFEAIRQRQLSAAAIKPG